MGSVQQISVVSDDVRPKRLTIRSRMIPPLHTARHTTTHQGAAGESDQQTVWMKVRRIVRAFERGRGVEVRVR